MTRINGIVRADQGFVGSWFVPPVRFRLLNMVTQRFFIPVVSSKSDLLSRSLAHLRDMFAANDLHVIDANLWMDGGKNIATEYHNDLWFSAPLENRVVQLWIPLVCNGAAEDVANSMLRLDPSPLAEGWVCASGTRRYTHLATGAEQPLPFNHTDGQLKNDLEGAIGGRDLNVGDTLFFDNAFCHYTLPSQAQRVGLAVRLCDGHPIYNGFFETSSPLDGKSKSDDNRTALKSVFEGKKKGQLVTAEKIYHRSASNRGDKFANLFWHLLFQQFHRCRSGQIEQFALKIANEISNAVQASRQLPIAG